MTTVLLVMSICSFILGLLFYIVNNDSLTLTLLILKVICLIAIITPVIYWLYLLNILK